MLHKHCIFIPFDGFENLKFFSQFCEKIKPDPILITILTLSETGSGTYVVKQGGANLPRMTFGFENYQNCPQM